MKRIAIIVQRCHESITGGSEALAWQYAGLLRDHYAVDILTTTAVEYQTWDNKLPAGIEKREGVCINRFPVTVKRTPYWHSLHKRYLDLRAINAGWHLSLQEEFIRQQGPYSQDLIDYLEQHHEEYQRLFFITYLYPTTYFGLQCVPQERAVLVPTLHDEPTAYMSAFRFAAWRTREILWLTEAERRLGKRLWGELPGRLAAMPVVTDLVEAAPATTPYLLYCGRIDEGKNCKELLDFFKRYRQERRSGLRLVLTGDDQLGARKLPDVDYRGFVSEQEKLALMGGAAVFVMPSRWESFSLATLEAMAQRTPVLVNGACEVLVDHVRGSGAGEQYRDYDSFRAGLDKLLSDDALRIEMGKRGREYVLASFQEDRVREQLLQAADDMQSIGLRVYQAPAAQRLKSCLCTQDQFESTLFQEWVEKLRPGWDKTLSGVKPPLHRKIWEWCYIVQALHERGLLQPGKRGLGFGVDCEPLAALFASYGCEIVATELSASDASKNDNSGALHTFDFVWSSCSIQRLGAIRRAEDFLISTLRWLKPGGVSVHTTEFNVSSNTRTLDEGEIILLRRRDIEEISLRMLGLGVKMEVDFNLGFGPADRSIDEPPYKGNPHLKLRFGDYVTTSFGLVMETATAIVAAA